MALLQISEPGQSTAPHEHRLAVGIDLGTTNSLVATVRSGIADTLPDEQGRHLLPSVVHYRRGVDPEVGEAALEAAADDPLNTIASVKRLMGRGVEDVKRLGNLLPYEFSPGASAMPRIKTVAGEIRKYVIDLAQYFLQTCNGFGGLCLSCELKPTLREVHR